MLGARKRNKIAFTQSGDARLAYELGAGEVSISSLEAIIFRFDYEVTLAGCILEP